MAIFKPFRALRPADKYAPETLCQPYDVVTHAQAADICAKNPNSFMHVIRADANFPFAKRYSGEVYHQSRKKLDELEKNGIFFQEDTPSYYIYSQTLNGRTQTGIVGCCSIDDYEKGIIKRHEITRAEKELDRICHFDTCSANTEPVFLIYRNNEDFKSLIQQIISESSPSYDVSDDAGVTHRLWAVSDSGAVEKIEKLFSELPALYIADGHHRTASAAKVGLQRRKEAREYDGTEEFNRFMAAAFAHDELEVLDYNRLIKDLNGLSVEGFMDAVKKDFDVTRIGSDAVLPDQKHVFTMYIDGSWYRLSLKQSLSDEEEKEPVKSLDVQILQDKVLGPVLGITDPRTDQRIGFSGGVNGPQSLQKMVDSGDYAAAFAVYPVSVENIMSVADAGMVMPPKSTWFEPKLGSGWFVHKI